MIQGGRVCTIRDSRGDDQLAACGQLGDVSKALRRPRGALRGGGGGGGPNESGGSSGAIDLQAAAERAAAAAGL